MMLGTSKNSSPKWWFWFNGNLSWQKVRNHLKQIQVMYLLNIILHEKEYKYLSTTPFPVFSTTCPCPLHQPKMCMLSDPLQKKTKKSIPTTCFCQLPPQQKNSSTEHGSTASTTSGCTPLKSKTRATNCKVLISALFFGSKWIKQLLLGG